MSEMQKRVATAIANVDMCKGSNVPCLDVRDKCSCWVQARAAIEAMREPTEKMLADADSAIPRAEPDMDGERMMGREVALEAWETMIDAALSESSSPASRPKDNS